MTCDTALLLADEGLFREAGYTGLSRGRHENRLYLVAEPDSELTHGPAPERDPIAGLVGTLERARRKDLAIDIATAPHPPGIGPPGIGLEL